tara:strand:+ start:130 stop:1275 length:1146 start_codon:yes stop_codon:yes gene_type:complete
MRLKGLSLFSNVGIAEIHLEKIGCDVIVANEILSDRARFYQDVFPKTKMICGDIREKSTFNKIVKLSDGIDFVITTPPCQGMSTAGKKDKLDPRNNLITYAIKAIRKINPKYVFIENVPQQLKTFINYKDKRIVIPEFLKLTLKDKYKFNDNEIINAADYGIPQSRTRSIILLTRKDLEYKWPTPRKKNKIVTLKDVIGDLPPLDPLIYDISYKDHIKIFPEYEKKAEIAKLISKWHYPPRHVYRQVISMIYTKTGKSAFENTKKYKPKKIDGTYVKGFMNTYKRQSWDKPGYTITTFNRTISSQENVHPGRKIKGSSKYSDPRVFTIYEIMKVMTIPTKWKIPSWCSENFLRTVIGEGIPPLLVKIFFQELIRVNKKNEK